VTQDLSTARPRRTLIASVLLGSLLLSACQSSQISSDIQLQLSELQAQSNSQAAPIPSDWLGDFNDPQLNAFVRAALAGNFSLREARARITAAREQAIIAGASLWPTLDLNAGRQRVKSVNGSLDGSSVTKTSNTYADSNSVDVSLAWELDLWGKLSASGKAAEYRFQAQQAQFDAARLSLTGDVTRAWFLLLANQHFNNVLDERVDNLQANLDIINNGYRQGINSALDVYLASSDLASEQSSRSAQKNTTQAAVRGLQLLLGHYPSGRLKDLLGADLLGAKQTLPPLPRLEQALPAGINAQVVSQRFDVQASFLELQASDRDLAVAHKARFPSFTLTGRVGDSSKELKDLLDQGNLAWNLLGNLTQPLFAGGRLKASEAKSRAELRQKEQLYLSALYTAFDEVESGLDKEVALRDQYQHLTDARRFAQAAERIAFEGYRQGLQDYTSVLDAQRRAFNAENNLINIQNELLQNRVALYLALGGEAQATTADAQATAE